MNDMTLFIPACIANAVFYLFVVGSVVHQIAKKRHARAEEEQEKKNDNIS